MAMYQFKGTVEKITITRDTLRNETYSIVQVYTEDRLFRVPWIMKDVYFLGDMVDRARLLSPGEKITILAGNSGNVMHAMSID